ncbi:ATP-grasp domain-containing protein [candidate division KSB1 bacterium]|nr:ATP-grasp domain-containing protein [candidate division KSB1 bacterium]
MKVAIIYNKDFTRVINTFGMQNKEKYNPKTVRMVADALEAGGHNVEIIDGNMHVIESLQNFMPKVLEGERMGMVFNMAYGIQGESRYTHLPSMLEMLGIPYVGSTPAGHALALDKVITKIIMQKHGIPTPNFWVYNSADENMSDVEFPVIIKPKMEAVSFGIKVAYNVDNLRDAVHFIVAEFSQQALVEQFVRGREFAVGLIGNNPVEAFPVLEIDLENNLDAIQTVEDKRKAPRQKLCPAPIPDELADEMKRWSVAAFKVLGLRDFARVDIRLDEQNNIYLLEINSMASLGATGSYSYAAKVAGYDYNALVNKMLDVAAVRYFANNALTAEKVGKRVPAHVRIRGFLRSRQSSLEDLLKKMVNLNTYVRNFEGVNSLGNLVNKELSALGFAQQCYPQVEVGNILYFSNTKEEEIDLLLLGNLDNDVRAARQEYFKISGQRVLGTGIWEHKGGLVVLVAALQALRFIKKIRATKIGVLLTSDDTLQGRLSRSILLQHAQCARYIIGLHGAFLNGGVVTSRSGAAVYSLTMKLIDNEDAANVALASQVFNKMIEDVVNMSAPKDGLVIAPHKLQFESNITEPFAHGEALISVRFHNPQQMKEIDSRIKKSIPSRKYKNKLDFQLEGGVRRPPMLRSEGVAKMYETLKRLADKLDVRLLEEHRWSSADISFIENNENKIDGLGPIGTKPSEESEYVLRHSLLERATLLATVLMEFCKKV